MTVYYKYDPNEPLSEEEIKMLDELDERPIVYDDDCPPVTKEMAKTGVRGMKNFEKLIERKKNENISVPVPRDIIDKILSKGFTMQQISEMIAKFLNEGNFKTV